MSRKKSEDFPSRDAALNKLVEDLSGQLPAGATRLEKFLINCDLYTLGCMLFFTSEKAVENDELLCVSQRDSRWAKLTLTQHPQSPVMEKVGCAVCCVTSLLRFVNRSDITPVEVLRALQEHKCFAADGNAYLTWSRVPLAYPQLTWTGACWQVFSQTPANLALIDLLLKDKPVILEVDFNPASHAFEQHFVLGIRWEDSSVKINERRLVVMEPWTGTITTIPPAFYSNKWDHTPLVKTYGKVARTVTGMRALGHAKVLQEMEVK